MDDWKDRIRELIASARLICVTVGRSESLLWEIGEIRAAGVLDRAIFLLPPTSQTEQRRRLQVLAHALGVDFALLDQTWPGRDVLAMVFPDDAAPALGGPVVITGRAPDDAGYEAAIASLTGTRPSDGFVHAMLARAAKAVRHANMLIRALVITAAVLCADKTPIRAGPGPKTPQEIPAGGLH